MKRKPFKSLLVIMLSAMLWNSSFSARVIAEEPVAEENPIEVTESTDTEEETPETSPAESEPGESTVSEEPSEEQEPGENPEDPAPETDTDPEASALPENTDDPETPVIEPEPSDKPAEEPAAPESSAEPAEETAEPEEKPETPETLPSDTEAEPAPEASETPGVEPSQNPAPEQTEEPAPEETGKPEESPEPEETEEPEKTDLLKEDPSNEAVTFNLDNFITDFQLVVGDNVYTLDDNPINLGNVSRNADVKFALTFDMLDAIEQGDPSVIAKPGDHFVCTVPNIIDNGGNSWSGPLRDPTTRYDREHGSVGEWVIKDGTLSLNFEDGYITECEGKIKTSSVSMSGAFNSYSIPTSGGPSTIYFGNLPVICEFDPIEEVRILNVNKSVG